MRMFRQGLKSEVRMELMRTGVAITDLRDLIEEATRIDNNLLEFRLEIRGPETHWKSQQNHRSTDKRPRKNFQPRGNLRPRVPGHYGSNGPESMHLDNMERGKPRSDPCPWRKPSNSKETRTCYNCNKPGHLAAKCRQPKKTTLSRYVNIVEPKGLSEAEDWEVVYKHDEPLIAHSPIPETPQYGIGPFDDNEETREMIRSIQDQFLRDGTTHRQPQNEEPIITQPLDPWRRYGTRRNANQGRRLQPPLEQPPTRNR
jgi:hypothetical protein